MGGTNHPIALRILQSFALGGQWGGASLLLTESSPRSRRGFYGSFVQVGAQLGLIAGLSSYLVLSLVLSDQQMLAWGWRIPFLSGIVMVGIGCACTGPSKTPRCFAACRHSVPPARASFGYQVGTLFGGGIAPFATASLLAATGSSRSVAGYIDVLAVISVCSIVLLWRRAAAGARELT